jgi:hypothetical protein
VPVRLKQFILPRHMRSPTILPWEQELERRREDERNRWAYLKSPQWRAKRQQVIERCNGICEVCRMASVDDVHHRTYVRFYNELLSDLQGLCRPCHAHIPHRL